ncbi:MAG: hypothetical protein ACRCS2_15150 [Morganella morganii]
MHEIAMRTYQVTFSGRDASGVLPMFIRVQAVTAKGARKAFIERFKPVQGWFVGAPQDITDRLEKEAEADSEPQK